MGGRKELKLPVRLERKLLNQVRSWSPRSPRRQKFPKKALNPLTTTSQIWKFLMVCICDRHCCCCFWTMEKNTFWFFYKFSCCKFFYLHWTVPLQVPNLRATRNLIQTSKPMVLRKRYIFLFGFMGNVYL